ncbi:hypothetical protein [Streptomyces sp. DW26H14]|uniref:hypothetical protein n=1 Tax=Streptomyces sp. DW26H14 TaxID=3435395 RepID=UPI00403DB72E
MRLARCAILTAAALTLGVSGLVANTSTPAAAAVAEYAKAGTPNFDKHVIKCVSVSGAKACFQPYGDILWVYGRGHDANWENHIRNSSGAWQEYRVGSCMNALSGNRWGYCNKNFYEDTTKNKYGGKGSGIRLQAEADGKNVSSQIWIRNNR